jgi:POT family proton-dependent oligopeptide transporter
MLAATVIFWLGRRRFVHLRPAGLANYLKELAQRDNVKALANVLMLVPFIAVFWALWQQNFSAWVFQAEHLDRHLFGIEWKPSQVQTVNPIFILTMLPLFSYVFYPALDRLFRLTPLRKIGLGLFTTALAFLIVGLIQARIDAGETPRLIWQILAFVVLTAAEVMVSVTHLEFAYMQAPRKMKSLVMCTYFGAISLGNFFTFIVSLVFESRHGAARFDAGYYFFFMGIMLAAAVLFVFFARFYRGQAYVQEEAATPGA